MEKIAANIYVETVYPGVNVGCIITGEGAICVDTPLLPGEAQRWQTRIRSQGAECVRFIVYTSGQQDRILGTQYLDCDEQPASTQPAPSSVQQISRPRHLSFLRPLTPVTPKQGKGVRGGTVVAQRLAWEQVKDHCTDSFKQSMIDMYGEHDPDVVNLEVIPPQITFDDRITLCTGDVMVTLLSAAKRIAWVWASEQRVLFVGDAVVVGTHPPLTAIDIQEWLATLERLRCEPEFQDAVIVPGRGPLCDTSATGPLTEYLRMAREKTLEAYRAGRPKAELNDVAGELLRLYPVVDGQRERVQRQIKLGLDGMYDEFKAVDAALE